MSEAARRTELGFVDSIWPKIKEVIDASIFALDTSSPGVEGALKVAADIALTKWRESQAVSLPGRDVLIEVVARALRPEDFWNESAEYPTRSREDWESGQVVARIEAEPIADAVLAAALSTASIPEIPDNSRSDVWALESQVHKIIADLDRARANGTVYTYGNIQERLRNALRLAARSNSPEIPDSSPVSLPDRNAVFEAIADRLGEHEKAYNEFDPSDEPVTCITLKAVPVEVLAEFIAPAVLAALSTQPAAGEVETQYRAIWPGGSTSMPVPSPIPLQDHARELGISAIIQSRTADYAPWVNMPEAQPTELANLFPGTLAALDNLNIRPEAK